MRILTLVPGPDAVPDATRLWEEIRAFNRALDFRLRFLHLDIEGPLAAPADVAAQLEKEEAGKVRPLAKTSPLVAAAELGILLDRERPELLIITGRGPLFLAGIAAAGVSGTPVALFGQGREARAEVDETIEAMDLGDDARVAVDRMSGVTRELR